MKLPRLSPSLVVSTAALVVAASGTSYAAGKYHGSQIAANAIASKHVRNGSLASADFSHSVRGNLRGATGPRGASGSPNLVPGSAGPTGDLGPAGATGSPGPRGAAGVIGSPGAKGPMGDTGATGSPGVAGSRGPAGANGNIGYQVVTSPVYNWDGFESAFIATPKCPAGTTIVDAEIAADIGNDDFKVKYWQYIQTSQGFPQQMNGVLVNSNASARSVRITSVCLAFR